MKPLVSMREAITDPALLGNLLAGESWAPWRSLLLAIRGEPLKPAELEHFQRLTGRTESPSAPVDEFWGIVGRRGGKTRAMSVLSAYIAALCDHRDVLVPGERGVLLLLAPSVHQARIAFGYIEAAFDQSPILKQQVGSSSAETLALRGGIDVQVRAASFRRLRGVTSVAVLGDETAFWQSDETSANADSEILDACRPSLATTHGPLICISSPYAQRGETFETWRRHYGPEGDPSILVAQGASRDFNPSLSQSVVDRALERDPAAARSEYLGQFRDDIAEFVSRAVVEQSTDDGVFERRPEKGITYAAFVDPSGGSSDSYTLAIGHHDGKSGKAILDCVREIRPPFSPEQATHELAGVLKLYGIKKVSGDRYGGLFPRELFRKREIAYHVADLTRSELYLELLPKLNSGAVRLLDNARLRQQLIGLERRTSRNGRDSIDHRPGSHDDLANAAAGVLVLAERALRRATTTTTGQVVGLI